MKKTEISITGMTCASCAAVITRALEKSEGVKSVNVNLTTSKGTVEFDESKINIGNIISIVQSKGYGASEATTQNYEEETLTKEKEIKSVRNRFLVSLL